jgi:perosamine synthetase
VATREYDESDLQGLRAWLDANQDSASEKLIGKLEELIARDYPATRVLATNSAMGALHLALQIAGVGPGDEVIVDPIVVFGGMAAMFQHAVPVFADVDTATLNIDPASIEARISPRTKAIICTHHFGSICDMESLLSIARDHNLPVIEDCAHALFATRNGKYAGLFADFAAFSFNHRKQLSTGQGGFLLINGEEFADRAVDRGFGRVPARLSWNNQMPGIVAALALSQWKRAKEYVHKDAELAKLYSGAIEGCTWMTPQQIPAENWCAYHIWAATYTGDDVGLEYGRFMEVLRENGGDYFLPSFMPYGAFGLQPSPVYRYPLFTEPLGSSEGLCPGAEYLVPRMFNTVLSPVEDERIQRYAEALHATVDHFS